MSMNKLLHLLPVIENLYAYEYKNTEGEAKNINL